MNKQTELAEQQLLGYAHAARGFSLKQLIESMALTKSEWKTIKKNNTTSLTESEISEIDDYFK